jgi:hypothetical protein
LTQLYRQSSQKTRKMLLQIDIDDSVVHFTKN